MMYRVEFTDSAKKQLKKIDKYTAALIIRLVRKEY